MTNLQNMNAWIWNTDKFANRRFLMQENYQKYLEGDEAILKLRAEQDPFWEPIEDLFIGISNFFIQSLCYCMDFEEKAFIIDYKGNEVGTLYINVIPCSKDGDALGENAYVDDSKLLINKPFYFKVVISSMNIIDISNAKGYKIKFKFFDEQELIETHTVPASPDMRLNFSRVIKIKSLTNDHLNHFETGCLTFMIYAAQRDSTTKSNLAKLSTRELKIYRDNEAKRGSQNGIGNDIQLGAHDMDPSQIKLELSLMQKKCEMLHEREKQIEQLCTEWSAKKISKETQAFISDLTRVLKSKPPRK